ncbi:hypothetical protein BB558_003209 [Smittium angustum]|uniref:GST N-terminal domain-containing protein n=1 Tax=Smittium angustum TaxID=133377 RepID=A0A2U1J6S7_SMIAN|nr:hypothetical protein BB558_003209 [Smittium angustum]
MSSSTIPFNAKGLTLYSNKACPFSHRAVITLHEAKIPYQLVEIDLNNKPSWYNQINPFLKVPTLRLADGTIVLDSAIISKYISEISTESQLMPSEPLKRANVRYFVEFFSSNLITKYFGAARATGDEEKKKIWGEIIENLKGLNQLLVEQSKGPYFLGNEFSLADILTITFIERLETVAKIIGTQFEGIPQLERIYLWKNACKERSSYKDTVASQEEIYTAVKNLKH